MRSTSYREHSVFARYSRTCNCAVANGVTPRREASPTHSNVQAFQIPACGSSGSLPALTRALLLPRTFQDRERVLVLPRTGHGTGRERVSVRRCSEGPRRDVAAPPLATEVA